MRRTSWLHGPLPVLAAPGDEEARAAMDEISVGGDKRGNDGIGHAVFARPYDNVSGLGWRAVRLLGGKRRCESICAVSVAARASASAFRLFKADRPLSARCRRPLRGHPEYSADSSSCAS
jgi:hypothetical protein